MIKAIHIQKSYGNLNVLRGVSLTINKGEFVSIVGKSGAGKSTLLHILGTLDQADAGQIIIGDTDVSKLSPNNLAAFRNERLGFVFQFHHLLPEFTALENVCIPAFIKKTSEKAAKAKAKELLDYLGLKDRLTHRPNQLSGGEQQRVAMARALINSPDVVFADEPTGNLDSVTTSEMHQLLFQLRNDFNQTFVIVTHNNELSDMSDRKFVMVDGWMDNE